MHDFLKEFITDSKEYQRLLLQEDLIESTSQSLRKEIEAQSKSLDDIAELLGKKKSAISRSLNSRNMTLRTLSDLSYALGFKVSLRFGSLFENSNESYNLKSSPFEAENEKEFSQVQKRNLCAAGVEKAKYGNKTSNNVVELLVAA